MTELVVTAIGAVTPVGFDAVQTATLLRAGVRPIRRLPFEDALGEPIGAVFQWSLPLSLIGEERLLELARPALDDVLSGAPTSAKPSAPAPLVLALDEGYDILAELIDDTHGGVDASASETLRAGHAGFGFALARAAELLDAGAHEVIVGAVASYCDPLVLRKLDAEFAILSRRSADGFVPSEAAVFARVRRPKSGAVSSCRVRAVRCGRETTIGTERPNCAEEITRLVQSLEGEIDSPLSWVLTDANGEPHRGRELSLLLSRCPRLIDSTHGDIVALGRVLGDVGAASMGLAFAFAAQLTMLRGNAAVPALLIGHADSGERAAVLVSGA